MGTQRRLLRIFVLSLTILLCGAPAFSADWKDAPYVAAFRVFSDPPGAHVYWETGEYMGETYEGIPLWITWGVDYSTPFDYTLTLRKRGYKTTTHKFRVSPGGHRGPIRDDLGGRSAPRTWEDMISVSSKLLIVMDTE